MKNEKNKINCCKKTSIGGQALMEGIMMRGPAKYALAVRNTKGEIVVEEYENKAAKRPAFCRWPIIRGILGYIDSMKLGYTCLMRSAELSGLEDLVEESPRKKKKRLEREAKMNENCQNSSESDEKLEKGVASEAEQDPATEEKSDDKIPSWVMTVLMIGMFAVALLLGVGLFVYVPTAIYNLIASAIPALKTGNTALNSLWKSIFEGASGYVFTIFGSSVLISDVVT